MAERRIEQSRWGEKPYRSLDWQMKTTYGEKVYKLALDGGMTCPNRDGTVGYGGCIFCSAGGSGDFAADRRLSVTEQIAQQKEALRDKKPARKYIAYFQAYTNTYAPVDYLEQIFTEAMSDPEVVILSIATRPDCLQPEILDLLERLNREKPVWIELGLQTMHEKTAEMIHRGYDLACFEQAVRELRARGIDVIVHMILGLLWEREPEALQTVDYLNHCDIQGVKLQLLHILKGTQLGDLYEEEPWEVPVMTEAAYVQYVVDCIAHLSPDITIHRLTGDGPKELLLAPMWSTRKRSVLNHIHEELKNQGIRQGMLWEGSRS